MLPIKIYILEDNTCIISGWKAFLIMHKIEIQKAKKQYIGLHEKLTVLPSRIRNLQIKRPMTHRKVFFFFLQDMVSEKQQSLSNQ